MKATWVAKLGGSLLEVPDLPDLGQRLETVLAARGGPRPILVVGGGQTVDLIRRWDRLFDLGEEAAHWIAVRALSVNARVVKEILPGSVLVESVQDCEAAWRQASVPIFDCFAFLTRIDERRENPLPRAWKVTSDSLAARIAVHFGAPELALLKSASFDSGASLSDAIQDGFVDAYFVEAARSLGSIVSINLREDSPEVFTLG